RPYHMCQNKRQNMSGLSFVMNCFKGIGTKDVSWPGSQKKNRYCSSWVAAVGLGILMKPSEPRSISCSLFFKLFIFAVGVKQTRLMIKRGTHNLNISMKI